MNAKPHSEAVREEYDRLANEYDQRWRPYIDATLRCVLAALDFSGSAAVLDIPCGTGELEQRLLARWPDLQITGVDLSPGMLRRARTKDRENRVTWLEADVATLPLADATFDHVICANSFHYFRDPERSLAELRRVLRPGGSLILVDWCDDFWTCKLCSVWLRWTDPAFHRTYSLRSCRTLIECAGFDIRRAERFRISWLWGLMRFVCFPNRPGPHSVHLRKTAGRGAEATDRELAAFTRCKFNSHATGLAHESQGNDCTLP